MSTIDEVLDAYDREAMFDNSPRARAAKDAREELSALRERVGVLEEKVKVLSEDGNRWTRRAADAEARVKALESDALALAESAEESEKARVAAESRLAAIRQRACDGKAMMEIRRRSEAIWAEEAMFEIGAFIVGDDVTEPEHTCSRFGKHSAPLAYCTCICLDCAAAREALELKPCELCHTLDGHTSMCPKGKGDGADVPHEITEEQCEAYLRRRDKLPVADASLCEPSTVKGSHNLGTNSEPSTEEAFAAVRRGHEVWGRHIDHDPGEQDAHAETVEAFALLERRMGTMARTLQPVLGSISKWADEARRAGDEGHANALDSIHDSLHDGITDALTDAPPVFTLEEVEKAVKEELASPGNAGVSYADCCEDACAGVLRRLAALRK